MDETQHRAGFGAAIKGHFQAGRDDAVHSVLGRAYRTYRMLMNQIRVDGRSSQDVFTDIYQKGMWGRPNSDDPFYSGSGSHDENLVRPYIEASRKFLQNLGYPDAVDYGCGDFAIGSQLRSYCRNYIAADIVEPLIVRNRKKFAGTDVDFRVADLASDQLPHGDVIFVRQVFQHMSNADIAKALAIISTNYKYLVVTEHLPANIEFVHNLDKAIGPDIRLYVQKPSGIVLTSEPFNLSVRDEQTLCEVPVSDGLCPGVIKTVAYELGSPGHNSDLTQRYN